MPLHFIAQVCCADLPANLWGGLLHAGSLLIAGEGNATSVAFGVGYESPTQFSREYSRFFGLPPSGAPRLHLSILLALSGARFCTPPRHAGHCADLRRRSIEDDP